VGVKRKVIDAAGRHPCPPALRPTSLCPDPTEFPLPTTIRRVQVFKRPGSRSPNWYLRFWEIDAKSGEPRQRWKSTGTTVRKQADQQRRDLEQQLEGQRAGLPAGPSERRQALSLFPPHVVTWDAFEQSFLAYQQALKPPATVELYTIALRLFRRTACPVTLSNVTRAVLEDFSIARLRQGAAPATVNRDLRHVRAALNWAARRDLIDRAPDFAGVFLRVPRKKPAVMPECDFLSIVAAAEAPDAPVTRRSGPWWRTFLYLGYYLGLRRGELLALTWRDIDVPAKEIRIQAASSKGRRERVLPLSGAIAELLVNWRRQSGAAESAAVLPWPFDTFNPLYDDWRLLQDAAGIPADRRYAPKALRSSCASLMIAASVPTLVVKDFLGHAQVTTTETYYVNTAPAMRAAANLRSVTFNQRSPHVAEE
jgi:integrase